MRFILNSFFVLLSVQLNAQNIEHWQGNVSVKGGWAPFDLVQFISADKTVWKIQNGNEEIVLDQIVTVGDSVSVSIPMFDTQIRARVFQDSLIGRFYKNYIENDLGLEFKAFRNVSRFENNNPNLNFKIDGRWVLEFENEPDVKIGVFEVDQELVHGSVLTNSGDMRFLVGEINPEGFTVSTFTGLSAYMLDVKILNDSVWEGELYSSKSKTHFKAKYNPFASLENPFLITKMKKGVDTLSFKLMDLNGEMVSLANDKYKNKVVIVSVLGSWCPNCLDEHAFLSEWYSQNKYRGVKVIGVAFERKDDPVYAQKFLGNLKVRLNIEYPLLFGGKVGSESTKKVFPEIEQIKIYPTTLFLGRDGKVKKIHTGYSGPATGLFYKEFQKEFNEIVNDLLQK